MKTSYLGLGLHSDPEEFEKFHKMNAHHFYVILRNVREAITCSDTTFRPAISAELGQLAVRVTKMFFFVIGLLM